MKAQQVFEQVTNDLVTAIEEGAESWRMPWVSFAGAGQPVSVEGRGYRGFNAMVLGMVGMQREGCGVWATYKGWQRKGCQVRRGERATHVTLWKPYESVREDTAGELVAKRGMMVKTFAVFAAEQVDGADEVIAARLAWQQDRDTPDRIDAAERFFAQVGARVVEYGNRAFYQPATDQITVPTLQQYDSVAHFYSTLAHEHVHWTGHESRLRRDLSGRFGSDAYAGEELVAELGAAFWAAQHGLSVHTRDDHAAYLAGWLRILRADPRALLTVAARAQAAVDFLNTRAGVSSVQDDDREVAA